MGIEKVDRSQRGSGLTPREPRQPHKWDDRHRREVGEHHDPVDPDLLAVMRAHEEEREWLAYEVHDRIAQTLASAFQQLQTVESLARPLTQIHEAAVRGSVLIRQAMREARSIMNDLRPPVLEDLGLIPLVEEELRRLEAETGCRATANLYCPVRPPRDVELILYRILHEALVNIRRHAGASVVAVSLHCEPTQARLQVEDNGAGFHVAAELAGKQVGGLISMRRRAELVGGNCRLESQPGHGTRMWVRIPCGARQPAPGGDRHV